MRYFHHRFQHTLGILVVLGTILSVTGCQNAIQAPTQISNSTAVPSQAGNSPNPAPLAEGFTATPGDVDTPQAATPPASSEAKTSASPNEPTSSASDTPGAAPQATAIPAASNTPVADWREIPIMPEISQRIFEIYQSGQAQGRDPHHFSVIGDCQAIPFVFLGPFERGELSPDSNENYLWDAINYFEGSFNRSGMAVRGGFTAASILSPIQADPHECLSGETPLTCEYRVHNPAFAFINLETWLDPNTVDRYEVYLRKIMDYVIEKGTVPILITKAVPGEAGEGEHVINPAIVKLANEYNVPVVNFWRSVQYLDNRGVDPTREGFHLSPEGYKLKNILALRAIYSIWTAVEQRDNQATPESTPPTPTVMPTSTATPIPQPTATPQLGLQITVPDCNGGCVFFGTVASHDGVAMPNGVFAFNYLTQQLTQVLGEGIDLQDVSANGQRLLVNEAARLYEVNLAEATSELISQSFFSFGTQGAYWSEDESQVIYLDQDHPIQTDTGSAINLLPSMSDGDIYFESGSCQMKANCQIDGVYHLAADQTLTRLDAYLRPLISPDGNLMALLDASMVTQDNYYHIRQFLLEEVAQGIKSRRLFYLPDAEGFMVSTDIRTYAFSADSSQLFILNDVYSDYYERSLRLRPYILDISNGYLYELGEMDGAGGSLNPRVIWSPTGDAVLLFLTELTPDNQYSLSLYQTNPATRDNPAPFVQGLLTSDDYFYITNLYWR